MTSRIEAIDRDIELILREDLSPAAQSAALVQAAVDGRDAAEEQNEKALGYKPHHDLFIDGARVSSLDAVRPDSRIVVEFDIINDVFAWIDLMLVTHAPMRSGRFRSSFVFLADGVPADTNAPTPNASEFVYMNTQPYAGKLERGLSKQSPDGVFQAVAALASKRFSNIAKIRFSYRPTEGARSAARVSRKMAARMRQPAIVITR